MECRGQMELLTNCLTVEFAIGCLTTGLALACVFIALPMQIRQNARLEKCAQPGMAIKLGLALLVCRHIYLPLRGEWMILVPETCALVMNCVLYVQYRIYPGLEPLSVEGQATAPVRQEARRNDRQKRHSKKGTPELVET
jgi:hypothetical protein